jgi:hypothetical protein
MSSGTSNGLREAAERRLLDRYANLADEKARAAFVGTSGRADWKAAAAGRVLGLWPRIKAVPVLGPAAHRMFTWLRKAGG